MELCFVYKKIMTGGAETLILRISKYLIKSGESVYLATTGISDVMKKQIDEIGIQTHIFQNWSMKNISKFFNGKHILYMAFQISDYYLLNKHNSRNVAIMYCVHPNCIRPDCRIKVIQFYKKIKYDYILKKGLSDSTFYMMDKTIKQAIKDLYSLDFPEDRILLLPYEKGNSRKKWGKSSDVKHVLTISRADFPFKSYILGLIESIKELNEIGFDLELTIVSYGDDIQLIEDKIKETKYIKLLGETDYSQLEGLYLNADIYVGMGSTAIEAAKYGLPVILANVNSPDFLSCGFFCDNPQAIGEFDTDGIDGYKLLTELLKMDRDMFINLADNCKNVFDNNYDMGLFINRIRGVVKNASN